MLTRMKFGVLSDFFYYLCNGIMYPQGESYREFIKKRVMSKTKVLFIAQEMTPYMPENELSKTCRELPQGIQERGHEIRVFTPKYGNINERRNQLHEVKRLSGLNLIIDDTDHPLIIKVASIQSARMQVYFTDNDDYFQRHIGEIQDEANREDNDERSIFFVRSVMETVKNFRWEPEIIHCHGWLSSLTPIYIKKSYADDPCFRNSKVVVSLYENSFTRPFDARFAEKLLFRNIDPSDIPFAVGDKADYITLSKFAIDYADGIALGSPNVNPELVKYAQEKGKLFLPYQSEDTRNDAFDQFYEQVWNNNN